MTAQNLAAGCCDEHRRNTHLRRPKPPESFALPHEGEGDRIGRRLTRFIEN